MKEAFLKSFLFISIKINFLQNVSLVFSLVVNDSHILRLLSIVHEINSSFDCDPTIDVIGVFLDISKAVDKVWHKGILFKLKTLWPPILFDLNNLPDNLNPSVKYLLIIPPFFTKFLINISLVQL